MKKSLLLILTIFLLIPFASAEDIIKCIKNVGAVNGTDTFIYFIGADTPKDTNSELYAGSLDGASRTLINDTRLTKSVIPSGATINWWKKELNLHNLVEGATAVTNIRFYPIKTSWEETVTWNGFNTGGVNMTDYNGTKNLAEEFQPTAGIGANEFFNVTIDNTYAQNFFDGNLGDWDEGFILIDNIAEGLGGTVYTSFHASDETTATYRPTDCINYTEAVVSDTTFPIVNASFNITNPEINDVINFSCNVSDETDLSTINMTWNMSNEIVYSNYTVSGTDAQISNSTEITVNVGEVINFTCYATDTSNNVKQNSTVFTIGDTPPTWRTNQTNVTSNTQLNDTIQLNITLADDIGLDSYIFSWDVPSFWVNFTAQKISDLLQEDDTEDEFGYVNNTGFIVNASNSVDEDTETFAFGSGGSGCNKNGFIYENYTFPTVQINDITWLGKYRIANNITNMTGNFSISGLDTLQLRTKIQYHGSGCVGISIVSTRIVNCSTSYWDGSDWKQINCPAKIFSSNSNFNTDRYYEGRISWNINGTVTNIIISEIKTINYSVGKLVNWTVYFDDTAGNTNQTDIFSFSIKNSLPNIEDISLIPSPATQIEDINFSGGIYSDPDGDTQSFNETLWYKNGVENESWRNFTTIQNTHNNNFSNNDKVITSMRVNDGLNYSNWVNSSELIIGDFTLPTLLNCTLQFSTLNDASGNTNNFSCLVSDASSNIDFIKFNLWTPLSNFSRTMTLNGTGNYIDSSYLIFESQETLATGSYSITNVTFKDSSGNRDTNKTTGFNFTVTSVPSPPSPAPPPSGGGGVIIITKKVNTTFDLLTENFGQEYTALTAFSEETIEVPILILNEGNRTVTVTIQCKESSNITATKDLCDFIEFERVKFDIIPSAFPIETIIKVTFPEAEFFETFSLIIEGTSPEGGLDDLRVSFVVLPKLTDIFPIISQMLLGVTRFKINEETSIPIPNIGFLLILEAIVLIIFIPRDFRFKELIIGLLTLLIVIITGILSFISCKLPFVECLSII